MATWAQQYIEDNCYQNESKTKGFCDCCNRETVWTRISGHGVGYDSGYTEYFCDTCEQSPYNDE